MIVDIVFANASGDQLPLFIKTMNLPPPEDISKLELLGWKATGCTTNYNSANGTWSDDVVVLDMKYKNQSGGSLQLAGPLLNNVTNGQVVLDIPKPFFNPNSAATLVPPGEIGQWFQNPLIIAYHPRSGIDFTSCNPALLKTNGNAFTYTNLYLWIRINTRS